MGSNRETVDSVDRKREANEMRIYGETLPDRFLMKPEVLAETSGMTRLMSYWRALGKGCGNIFGENLAVRSGAMRLCAS